MTNFEAMDKDKLAADLGDGSYCDYCLYDGKPECDDIPFTDTPCADGIRKWFDEESPYDD